MFIDTLRLRHRCGCVNRYAALASPLLLRQSRRCACVSHHCCVTTLLCDAREGLAALVEASRGAYVAVTVTGAVVVASCNRCAAIACVALLQTARHTTMIDGAASFPIVMLHGGCNLLYVNSHIDLVDEIMHVHRYAALASQLLLCRSKRCACATVVAASSIRYACVNITAVVASCNRYAALNCVNAGCA